MSFLSESEEEYEMSEESNSDNDSDSGVNNQEGQAVLATDPLDRSFWGECKRLVEEESRLETMQHDLEQREIRLANLEEQTSKDRQESQEQLAAAWLEYEKSRKELDAERAYEMEEISRKRRNLEARDCFWYLTGAKLRSLLFFAVGLLLATVLTTLAIDTQH